MLTGPTGRVRSGWKVAAFLALSVASVTLAAVLVGMFAPAWALRDGQPWSVVAVSALLILGVHALFLRLEGRGWAEKGLLPDRRRLGQLAAGLAGGVALVGGLAWLLMLAGVLYWQPNRQFTAGLMAAGTAYFLGAVLVEELVFRGYALRRLTEGIGPTGAVTLLAVVFSGYHLLSIGSSPAAKTGGLELIWTAAGPLVGAIVFAVAALRTGSIALPLGLHLGWNWTQWHFFTFPTDDNPVGLWTPMVVTESPAPFRVGYLVTMTVALLAVALLTRRPRASHPTALPAWTAALGSWFGPEQDSGEGECGLVLHGEFVVRVATPRQCSSRVDTAFGDVAPSVGAGVEGGLSAAVAAASLAVAR